MPARRRGGGSGDGSSFSPSKSNIYNAVKAIFHPATNAGVAADDTNRELDVAAAAAPSFGALRLNTRWSHPIAINTARRLTRQQSGNATLAVPGAGEIWSVHIKDGDERTPLGFFLAADLEAFTAADGDSPSTANSIRFIARAQTGTTAGSTEAVEFYLSKDSLRRPLLASSHTRLDGNPLTISRLETQVSRGTGGSVAWGAVTGKPAFAAIATSGAYSDLVGAPGAYVLPAAAEATRGGVRGATAAQAGDAAGATILGWSAARIVGLVAAWRTGASEQEASAGTATALRFWSAQRVRQAVTAILPRVYQTGDTSRIPRAKLGSGAAATKTALFDEAWRRPAFDDLTGTAADNQIPAGIARDTEVAAAVADNVNGGELDGSTLELARRSGANPIEIDLSGLEAMASGRGLKHLGFWRPAADDGDGNFLATGIMLPAAPDNDKIFIVGGAWGGAGYSRASSIITGAFIKRLPVVAVGASAGGLEMMSEGAGATVMLAGKLASGELLLRNDEGAWSATADFFVLLDPDGEAPEGGYLFYDRRQLAGAPVTTDALVPAAGHMTTLLAAIAIQGRIYADTDFVTEFFGTVTIDGDWNANRIRNYRLTMRTAHAFNGKALVHHNPVLIPAVKGARLDFPLSHFNSVSSVSPGAYSPPGGGADIEITEADLRGPTTITYQPVVQGLQNNGTPDATPWTLEELTFQRPQVRSYQIGNAHVEPGPPVLPSISSFALDGDLAPAAGVIAEDYTATWAVAQSSHLSALRIVRFSGTDAAPAAVTVIANIQAAAFHGGTHALTVSGFSLAAGETETVRIEGYGEGQTPATDQPVTYHDVRITAHATAAQTRFVRVRDRIGNARPTAANLIANATVISTAGTVIGDWAVAGIPNDGNDWLVGWIVPQSGTQPSHYTQGGINNDAAYAARFALTESGVDYWVYLLTDDGSADDTFNGTTITVS